MRANALQRDLSVISSSQTGFHFQIKNDFIQLEQQTEADSTVTYFKTVRVGIPYGATVTLLSVHGDMLSPLNADRVDFGKLSSTSYPLAVVSEPITVRGRQLVVVSVFPVVGKAMYRELTVKLGFTGGLTDRGQPANDPQFDRIFRAALANFNQFRTWSVPARDLAKVAGTAQGLFGVTSAWYKLAVNQTGLYKVTGAQLQQAGLVLDDLPSDSIRLFSGGGLPLEVPNDKPRPAFTEVAVLIEDGGDGFFNTGDFIVFYGEAVDRWLYRADSFPRFVNNPYEDRNTYWLSASGFPGPGQRMIQVDATPGGVVDTVITTFQRRVHVEEDNILRHLNDGSRHDYYAWYWTKDPELTFFVPTIGLVEGDSASVGLFGITYDNSEPDDSVGYIDLDVNGVAGFEKSCNGFNCRYRTTSLIDGLNEIHLTLWPARDAPPHFDYMNLEYTSRLVPVGNELEITLGAYAGSADIEVVDDFEFPLVVLNIDDPVRPTELIGFQRDGGLMTFHSELEDIHPNRFYVRTIQRALAPLSIVQASPTDLRTASEQVDLLIVTPEQLSGYLTEYIDFRQSDGYSMTVVTVEDIMDNFSYGLYDPTAIRDFLKYAYENYPDPSPSAVLMAGDGSFDFLDHLKTRVPNYVPPYVHPLDESVSDDNYVYFGNYGILDSDTSFFAPDRGYDMLTARWPVRSVTEINTILSKIKRYEDPSTSGSWRTRMTLVADDEHGGFHNESFHTTQTEELEKEHIPRLFHRNKIYLWEYPFVNRWKPAVNDKIVSAINEGTLLLNYVGHGNPNVWAHERVFTRAADVARLTNDDKLPLIFTASCAIGFFDDPSREGMAEDLLAYREGGAIGIVSATRLVYSSDNARFNQKVFDVLLYADSLSICESVYTAKLLRQYGISPVPRPEKNDRAYLFFGDPYLKLGKPKLTVEFSNPPVGLTALGQTQVAGRIVDTEGNLYSGDGVLTVTVYDSERQKTYRLVNSSGQVIQTVDYSVTRPTIYPGSATITDGAFDSEFISPLDIGYGGQGARIVGYALLGSTDAAGLIDSLGVSDSLAATTDSTGPTIEYALLNRPGFISGDLVGKSDIVEITASDPSGINLTGGLGHGISIERVGESENPVNLTARFEYNQDDFTTGSVSYSLEEAPPGRHTFKIKAWDNANNSTSVEFTAEVLASADPAIVDLLNYPNPMKDSTRFSMELTQPVEKLTLEIFTLSGRKIKSFGPHRPSAGYYDEMVWDGRDTSGDRVATGVYIYKATAVPLVGGEKVESFGKIVVIN
jgi:hypothetical protein